MGHTYLVKIGEHKPAVQRIILPMFGTGVMLESKVTSWFVNKREYFSLFKGACHVHLVPYVMEKEILRSGILLFEFLQILKIFSHSHLLKKS